MRRKQQQPLPEMPATVEGQIKDIWERLHLHDREGCGFGLRIEQRLSMALYGGAVAIATLSAVIAFLATKTWPDDAPAKAPSVAHRVHAIGDY